MVALSQSSDDEGAYSRISIEDGSDVDKEAPQAAKKLLEAMSMRDRYMALNPRQYRWAFEGKDAFSCDSLPQATQVRSNRTRVPPEIFTALVRPLHSLYS